MKRDDFTLQLDVHHELIVDNFAGGGGASLGIEMATGRRVDIAVNHDPEAIALHSANHPETRHFCESVWDIDPRAVTEGRPVALGWFSPDCKHFSKAKGGKPREKKIRGLAWVAVRWAATVRPRVIMLENVEEFLTWGPLTEEGQPCPRNKGRTFRSFVNALRALGYVVDWREMRAFSQGTPTIRKRLFLIARSDGKAIVWPEPVYGNPDDLETKRLKLKPWNTSADCIDWSIPCPSIFERSKPLAEATLRRIARGIQRYVINNPKPYLVTLAHGEGQPGKAQRWGTGVRATALPLPTVTASGGYGLVAPVLTEHANGSTQRNFRADEPLRIQCAEVKGGHFALVAPTLVQTGYGEREGQAPRSLDLDKPIGTIVGCGVKHALAAATLIKHYGGNYTGPGVRMDEPMHTTTTTDHHALVSSNLVKLRNHCVGQALDEPIHTITGGAEHFAEVRAFLVKYYSEGGQDQSLHDPMHTIPCHDRLGLVTVAGVDYAIADIGMRMLTPRELYRAQGFPDSYKIDIEINGRKLPKHAQVRMAGNSVCPQMAAALVRANLPELAIKPMERIAA